MRITLFFLFFCILFSSATNSFSQEFTFKQKSASIREICRQIEKESDYVFVFSDNSEKIIDQKVNIDANAENVAEILDAVLSNTGLTYKILDKQIVIYEFGKTISAKVPEHKIPETIIQQPPRKQITGSVTDAGGQPLPGATVVVKGTTMGTVTDADGNFSMDIPLDAETLQFSFVGMRTQEIPIDGRTTFTVVMEEETIGLEEVVAIGYGEVRRRDLTGSVSSVSNEDLVRVPVHSITYSLQGRAPGVYVTNTNTQPGGNISIRIRGTNSIQGNNEPLYVIDGLIGGNIETVAPSDIESIDILKDASSTAIYGSRGANGVVLITTKRGKSGQINLNFDAYYGVQSISNKLDLMNAREYAGFRNALEQAKGNNPAFPNLNNLPADTDWQDQFLQIAPIQDYRFSASGGTEKFSHYLSAGFQQQEGIVIGTKYQRYNLRLNVDSKISDRINIGGILSVSHSKRFIDNSESEPLDDHPVAISLQMPPTVSPYDENGNLLRYVTEGTPRTYGNPQYYLKNIINNSNNSIAEGNIFAEIGIIKGLKFRSYFGFDFNSGKSNFYKASHVFTLDETDRSIANVSTSNRLGWISENYFTFTKDFKNQTLQMIGGFTAQDSYMESISGNGSEFPHDGYEYHDLSAAEIYTVDTNMSEESRASFYGRIHYNLLNKYLVTVNGRYDGFSGFGKANKWGLFPSIAVAWRLSEEPFFKNIPQLYNLKLRASYGISGSEALGPYNSFNQMVSTYLVIGGQKVNGVVPGKLANPNLGWEQTNQTDVGLDASFFSGKLNLVFDYYNKKTTDLFLNKPLPYTSGVPSVTQNIGSIRNQGFEFGIDGLVMDTELKWNIEFNITHLKSEVIDLGMEPNEEGIQRIILGNVGGLIKIGNVQVIQTGEPYGTFFGYETDGIWQQNEIATAYSQFGSPVTAGDLKYVDQNGDGNINDEDRTIIGNAQPSFFGGFNNTFRWKNWDASVFLQYTIDVDVLNSMRYLLMDMGSRNNHLREALNYWTPDNPNTNIPRINYSSSVISDRIVEDASFLRCREITIGYSIPSKKLPFQQFRLYFTGTNLFTFTNYSGYDPEVNMYGSNMTMLNIDNGSHPRSQSYVLGVNITF